MDNNLNQLKVLAEVFNTDKIITSDEIEQVLKGILSIMNSFKKGNEELNSETKQVVGDLLQRTLAEYDAIKDSVSQETLQAGVKVATEFDQKVDEIKGLMAEVMTMKPTDFDKEIDELKGLMREMVSIKPKDGKPADETKIVEKVLSKIKIPEYKETVPDDREKIVQKINSGTKKDTKIEFSQVGGTDKFHKDILNRAVEILDQRTTFLINKNVKHDSSLSGSGTDADPLSVVGGAGTSDHALLTHLDYASSGHTGFEPAKGADDNFVTDAEKVVIGNTSGTNTGDNATNTQYSGLAASKLDVVVDGTPNTDHTANGPQTNTFVSGYTSAIGDLVFFGSGGKWLEVDADAVATCNGLMGIALEAKTDTQAMLVALPGSFVRDDSWNWTVGATLYAGETLGSMQETIPTGADAIIKVVGFAVSADVIYFNPSPDQQSTVA